MVLSHVPHFCPLGVLKFQYIEWTDEHGRSTVQEIIEFTHCLGVGHELILAEYWYLGASGHTKVLGIRRGSQVSHEISLGYQQLAIRGS